MKEALDLNKSVLGILKREVDSLSRKQQIEGELDINDIRKVEMLTRTAATLTKVEEPDEDLTSDMDLNELIQEAIG